MGKEWAEWRGEFFVSKIDEKLYFVMKDRILKAKNNNCDFVEFDNMDWADE